MFRPSYVEACIPRSRTLVRQTWYIGVDEIPRDPDRFLRYYNLERSHQGYRLKGRTPAQALMEALAVTEIPDIRSHRGDQ